MEFISVWRPCGDVVGVPNDIEWHATSVRYAQLNSMGDNCSQLISDHFTFIESNIVSSILENENGNTNDKIMR